MTKRLLLVLVWFWMAALPCMAFGRFDQDFSRALRLLEDEKYVQVREIAERMLTVNASNPFGNYLMGAVYARGEGSLPRAHFYLDLARGEVTRPFSGGMPKWGMEQLHAMVMEELIQVSAEMDQYQEELDLLTEFDRVYGNRMTSWYGWPLMKLNRFDQAKEMTERAMLSPDEQSRTRALNTMGAIESTLDHAQAAFNIFVQLVDEVKAHHWEMQSAFLCNAGEAAMILNRFDDAERYLLEGTDHFDSRSYSDPYELLSVLYAGEARLPEAVDSVKKMHRWSRARQPALEQQSWAFEQQVSAEVLLALGYNDAGLSILRRVLDRPDRRGAVTGSPDESESGLLMIFQYALRLRQAELGEQMSWLPVRQWFGNWLERITLSRQVWQADSRVAALVIQNHRLEWSLRPYAADSSVVEWIRGDMCDVLGAGVTEAEVDRLLARDGQDAAREEPYLQLIKGECELHRWAWRDAKETLEKGLARLPAAEVLLHARGEALLAQACQHAGDSQAAMDHLQRAMERFPGVIRALQMSLPVSIRANGDAACQEAARMLNHSPRFDNVGSGFIIDVTTQGNSVTGSLRSPNGSVLCNVSSPLGTDATESARLFCQSFHSKAFASQMDLSQTDITSLDGSNQTGEAERRQIEQLLTPGHTGTEEPLPTASPSPRDVQDLLR